MRCAEPQTKKSLYEHFTFYKNKSAAHTLYTKEFHTADDFRANAQKQPSYSDHYLRTFSASARLRQMIYTLEQVRGRVPLHPARGTPKMRFIA